MNFGEELGSKGFKLTYHVGKKVLHHVLFQVFHFGIYVGMHVGVDGGNMSIKGGNIGIHSPHFLLDHGEIMGQRIEARFKVLVVGVGHGERRAQEGGWVHMEKGLRVKGITMIDVKRGIQWCRSQIRGSGGGRDHEETNG
jgi:hypothetical protein